MSSRDSILTPTGRRISDRRYHEAGVRGRFESNLRVVRGRFDTTGPTILEGYGYSVAKNGVGNVTLTFDPAFSGVPTVTAMAGRTVGPNGRIVFEQAGPTESSVGLGRVKIDDTYDDGTIHFRAEGPA